MDGTGRYSLDGSEPPQVPLSTVRSSPPACRVGR